MTLLLKVFFLFQKDQKFYFADSQLLGVWTRVWNGIFNVTTGLQTTNMLVFVTVDIGGTTLINGTIPVTTV